MKKILQPLLVSCLAALSIACSDGDAQSAPPISQVIVFGDSNVDSGAMNPRSFDVRTAGLFNVEPNAEGRNSNGPVVVEQAAQALGVMLDNYAVSGATTGTLNLVTLLVGAGTFPALDGSGVAQQIDDFEADLNGDEADAEALYVYWAGSNDLYGATPAQEPLITANALINIEEGITQLNDLGARRILVASRTSRIDLEGDDNLNGVAFNEALETKIIALDDALAASVELFDAYAITEDIARNPVNYGFSNVVDHCFDDAACYDNPNVSETYVQWDAAHKTTAVHTILANSMVEQANQLP